MTPFGYYVRAGTRSRWYRYLDSAMSYGNWLANIGQHYVIVDCETGDTLP